MNTPPNREVALFSAALELEANQRGAYLNEACADDPPLRLRLEALLHDHDAAISFLETPARGAQPSPSRCEGPGATVRLSGSPAEKAGDRIGRYKLLQQIGEGGCGVVYMAEQEEPVRRPVALKVIKLGMDTKQVVARFEAERQALALMDHPNIAKVFDAGATEAGRPYFVMELVRGVRITEYCDQYNLSTRERLDLFVQVCGAIQHAHQKGVIHRDIKPSNILVTVNDGVPVPKVIDFGIAKATGGQTLTDKTLFTAFEQFIGTPAYMSPEQAMMTSLDIDTRSDLYSLGVLLYELLTGQTPFDAKELMAAGLDEMRRIIREQEPMRPSTRLSTMLAANLTTVARHRQCPAPKLFGLIRGDLDWIVMKALEKDRTRRYETANGLAMDIQRHLNCEPVVARPPSRLYEFQKSVRRHKFGFAAAAGLITVLTAGALVSALEAVRATRAEREQNRLRQQAVQAGKIAKRQEQLARESADDARRQQGLASEQELLARRRFYAAQMNLANQAVDARQLGRALALLETQRPKAATEDLRTFEWYHLWGLCNGRLRMTLRAHKAPVNSVAFSWDGRTLASASEDSTIHLWETSTGREGITLNLPPGNPVFVVAFTPDGKTLAAGYWDGRVRLWDVASAKLRATLPDAHGWVRSLAISSDGRFLGYGGDDGVVKLFNLATEAEQRTLSANQGGLLAVAFSKDGGKLASAYGWGLDGTTVRIWDLMSGQTQPRLLVPVPAGALAFSPDGKMLATAAWGNAHGWDRENIQVWDTISGQLQATLKGHSPPIHSLAWLPDGKGLVSCASDRTVRLWPMSSTNSVVTESEIIGEHLDAAMCLAISADGTALASGANDGSVKLWKVAQTREQAEAQVATHFQMGTGATNGALLSLLVSPDSNCVFGVMEQGTAAIDIVSGQDYPVLSGASGRGALSPNGKLLATGDKTGTVKLWGQATGRLLAKTNAHTSDVALAFSPDGRMLVTCGFGDPVLKAWDPAAALNLLWGTDAHCGGILALAFSPDGKTIAAWGRHQRVDFFDASTGRQHWGFEVERGVPEVLALAFSPDGKFLATGSESGAAKLWNVETGRLHAALQGHTATIHAVAFSPDGGTLATGSEDQTVRLWDVATGQERITLKGLQSGVRGVGFSPDGNTLAAGSLDGVVRLWRASRSAEATAYGEQEGEVAEADAANYNARAWALATDPDSLNRDGQGAVRLAEKAVAATHRTNAIYLDTLAAAYAEQGQFTKAVSVQQEAIALLQSEQEREDYASRLTLYENNAPYRDHPSLAETETLLRRDLIRVRELSTNAPSGEVPGLGVALHHLAGVLCERNALAEARPLAEEAAALYRRHPDWPPRERQHAFNVLGDVLTSLGDLTGAEAVYREQLQNLRAGLAPDDPGLAGTIGHLTATLLGEKRVAEAGTMMREYVIRVRRGSTNAPSGKASGLGVALHHLAEVLREQKVLAEARPLAQEAAALYQAHPDWPPNERQHANMVLRDVLTDLGDFSGLEALYREQLRSLRPQLEPGDPELAAVIAELTSTLLEEKKFTQAEPLARECLTIREKKLPDDWRTFNARSMLGGSLLGQEKYGEAEPLLVSAYEGMKQREVNIPLEGKPRLSEVLRRLVQLYEATNRPDQAADRRRKLAELDKAGR